MNGPLRFLFRRSPRPSPPVADAPVRAQKEREPWRRALELLQAAFGILTKELDDRGQNLRYAEAFEQSHADLGLSVCPTGEQWQHSGIDIDLSDDDLELSTDVLAARFLAPAMCALASILHHPGKILLVAKLTPQFIGIWSEILSNPRSGLSMRLHRGEFPERQEDGSTKWLTVTRFDVLYCVTEREK